MISIAQFSIEQFLLSMSKCVEFTNWLADVVMMEQYVCVADYYSIKQRIHVIGIINRDFV